MSYCNNDVTYNDKWDTPENLAALKKVEDKFFHKSVCYPSCPAGWAPEVLALLESFERELGIRWNEDTIRSYYVQGNLLDWLVKSPFLSAWNTFRYHFVDEKGEYYKKCSFLSKLSKIAGSFFGKYAYAKNAIRVKYVAPLVNKILKPKFTLSQVKEKYGSLRIYYSCPEAFEGWVEQEIRKCELRLAVKGCYYPVESFWDAGSSYNIENEYEPDSIKVEYGEYKGERTVSISKTTYRKAMKELGLDLKEIEQKAIIRKASKADPV